MKPKNKQTTRKHSISSSRSEVMSIGNFTLMYNYGHVWHDALANIISGPVFNKIKEAHCT